MFERYAEPARRAIFFACARTIFSHRPEITSVDLLASLLWENNSRAQTLFNLRDYFPLYCGCPRKVTTLPPGPERSATGPRFQTDPGMDRDRGHTITRLLDRHRASPARHHPHAGMYGVFVSRNDRVDSTWLSQDDSRQ